MNEIREKNSAWGLCTWFNESWIISTDTSGKKGFLWIFVPILVYINIDSVKLTVLIKLGILLQFSIHPDFHALLLRKFFENSAKLSILSFQELRSAINSSTLLHHSTQWTMLFNSTSKLYNILRDPSHLAPNLAICQFWQLFADQNTLEPIKR